MRLARRSGSQEASNTVPSSASTTTSCGIEVHGRIRTHKKRVSKGPTHVVILPQLISLRLWYVQHRGGTVRPVKGVGHDAHDTYEHGRFAQNNSLRLSKRYLHTYRLGAGRQELLDVGLVHDDHRGRPPPVVGPDEPPGQHFHAQHRGEVGGYPL